MIILIHTMPPTPPILVRHLGRPRCNATYLILTSMSPRHHATPGNRDSTYSMLEHHPSHPG